MKRMRYVPRHVVRFTFVSVYGVHVAPVIGMDERCAFSQTAEGRGTTKKIRLRFEEGRSI